VAGRPSNGALAFVHIEVTQGHLKLISLPGVVRTRTEVALREGVAHRLLPLVASTGCSAAS
jgi:hypothetical protein